MRSTRLRLALVCLAVVGAAIGAAGGSAGNRTAEVTLEAFPGPAVTAGENIAYRTSMKNTGSSNFTHVELRQRVPVAKTGGVDHPAMLVSSSCGAVVRNGEAVCTFGSLRSGATVSATLLWGAPTGASCSGCLETDATWLIKEGKPTNANEAFKTDLVKASLLGGDGSQEKQQAGGYETASANCTSATGNLHTNQALSSSNPVSSTVCLPAFTVPQGGVDLGLASLIVESSTHQHEGGHPELGQSDVCVAAFGQNCGGTYTPQNFAPNVVTFIFRIHNSALTTVSTLSLKHGGPPPPSSKKITQVFHNGFLLPKCSVAPNYVHGCFVSITQDSSTKIWTVTARASTNGYWDW
jgi:hypothetical protein